MSSYTIDPKKNYNHVVCVGWDPMLNTFFLHVIDAEKGEDDEGFDVLWIGTEIDEIHDVDFLLEKAQEYGEVSDELERDLHRDARGAA